MIRCDNRLKNYANKIKKYVGYYGEYSDIQEMSSFKSVNGWDLCVLCKYDFPSLILKHHSDPLWGVELQMRHDLIKKKKKIFAEKRTIKNVAWNLCP